MRVIGYAPNAVLFWVKGNRAVLAQPEAHLAQGLKWHDKPEIIEGLRHILGITSRESEHKVGQVLDTQLFAVFHDLDILDSRGPFVYFSQESVPG